MMRKNNETTGVIIGRFQPFHYGHAWLIKKSLEKFSKLIILIGSSNIEDENNLWDLEKRFKMLNAFIKHEGLAKKIIRIADVVDVPDDEKWLEIALGIIKTKEFSVIGDNEWVNGIFESKGYKVLRTGFFQRELYEGLKIRKLFNENKNWQERIPDYVVKFIK